MGVGPHDKVKMERRVLVAIFLSFLVLYVYQALVVKPVPKPVGAPTTAPASAPIAATTGARAEAPGVTPGTPERETTEGKQTLSAAAMLVGETSERDIRVETRDVIAVFTNRGARLKSWRLKHYLDQLQQPQELIATELSATQPLPFSLRAPDEAVTMMLNDALYTVKGAPSGDRPHS